MRTTEEQASLDAAREEELNYEAELDAREESERIESRREFDGANPQRWEA